MRYFLQTTTAMSKPQPNHTLYNIKHLPIVCRFRYMRAGDGKDPDGRPPKPSLLWLKSPGANGGGRVTRIPHIGTRRRSPCAADSRSHRYVPERVIPRNCVYEYSIRSEQVSGFFLTHTYHPRGSRRVATQRTYVYRRLVEFLAR